MFDMSWGEVLVIGTVALIVIGPKDLPKALRTVGQMTGKIRRMAGEFQSQFNEAMREAELDEIRKQVSGVNDTVTSTLNTSFNPIETIRDELKGVIEAKPVTAGSTEPTVTAAEPSGEHPAPAAAPMAALPGEPAYDLALPPAAPAPEIASMPGEPAPASAPAETRPESAKA